VTPNTDLLFSAPVQRNPAQFAARMMAKYGHVAGQGLGANADGIVEPIMLERAGPAKVGKKGESAEEGKPKKPAAGGMGIGGSKMGRIVNSQAEEKNRAELAKYGESSRIVLLRNMVDPEGVDENLQAEIGAFSDLIVAQVFISQCFRRRVLEVRNS
jgi:splicing factor 45